MSTPKLTTSAAARRRGSTLLLVLAAILLSMLLGLAYMQMVRLDRKGTFEVLRQRDIDMVGKAAMDTIGQQLTSYLDQDSSGGAFDSGSATNDQRRYYDYPDTNEPWLASASPGTDSTDATTYNLWPQISLLTGKYADNSTSQDNIPVAAATTTSQGYSDFGDADGDGILDSKGEGNGSGAPFMSLRGIDYYIWVRVIDNSALVNANVALSQVNNSGSYDVSAAGTDAARWWYPSELDLGGFVYSFNYAGSRMTELTNLLNYRLGKTTTPLTDSLVSWSTRGQFWLNGAAMYGNYTSPYQQLGIDSELELRYRNGLNNNAVTAGIEKQMGGTSDSALLRSAQTESTYAAALSNMGVTSATPMLAYFSNEPRHQMTTISGHAIFAPRLSTVDSAGQLLQRDINKLAGLPSSVTPTTIQNLSDELYKVLSQNGGPTLPTGIGNPKAMANQLAVNIIDYADTDSKLTSYTANAGLAADGNTYYGLEPLPFLCETYTQGTYQIAAGGTPNADGTTYTVTWKLHGNIGYVIEIRNPFARPVDLSTVHLHVNAVDWGTLSSLAGKDSLDPGEVLLLYRDSGGGTGSDAIAPLINAPATGTQTKVAITKDWPIDNTGAAPTVVVVGLHATLADGTIPAWPYAATASAIQLPATINDPAFSAMADPTGTSGYIQSASLGNANKLNMVTIKPTADAIDGFEPWPATPPAVPTITYDETATDWSIAADTKAHGPTGPIPAANVNAEQIVFSGSGPVTNGVDTGSGVITQVGELAHIAILGPDATHTVAENWADATSTTAHMLNFTDTKHVGAVNTDLDVPHAVVLLERLTTMSPAEDTFDNDGNGKIDGNDIPTATTAGNLPGGKASYESFVPGTINLNTVSPDMLQYVLPIPDQNLRTALAKAIVDYRDNPTTRTAGRNGTNQKGIAYVGELANLAPFIAAEASKLGINNPDPGANTTDNQALNGKINTVNGIPTDQVDVEPTGKRGTIVDFLGNKDASGTTPDGFFNDAEEKSLVIRWLAQTCSTRSDVFTAYILVRGYNPSASTGTTTPLMQRRFLVVFDRSHVLTKSDTPRILGILTY